MTQEILSAVLIEIVFSVIVRTIKSFEIIKIWS